MDRTVRWIVHKMIIDHWCTVKEEGSVYISCHLSIPINLIGHILIGLFFVLNVNGSHDIYPVSFLDRLLETTILIDWVHSLQDKIQKIGSQLKEHKFHFILSESNLFIMSEIEYIRRVMLRQLEIDNITLSNCLKVLIERSRVFEALVDQHPFRKFLIFRNKHQVHIDIYQLEDYWDWIFLSTQLFILSQLIHTLVIFIFNSLNNLINLEVSELVLNLIIFFLNLQLYLFWDDQLILSILITEA